MPVASRKKQTTTQKQDSSIPGHVPSIIVPIDGIEEYEKNYNMHGQEQLTHLEQSLSDFGQFKNIIIWNGQCIAGNGLLMAARQRGDTHIEIKDYSHLTRQQAEALLIADNATPAGSIADVGKLQSLLSGLEGVKIPGVTPDWEALMGLNAVIPETSLTAEAVLQDQADADAIECEDEPPIIQRGEIWQCGMHRMMCGDSTHREDMQRLMNGQRAEIVFTSPPYADLRDYDGESVDVDTLSTFIPVCAPYADHQCVNLGIKQSDFEVVEYWKTYIQAARRAGLKLLSWNVWNRDECGSVAQQMAMFAIYHEWIFVFGRAPKELRKTIECKLAGTHYTVGTKREKDGTMSDVWTLNGVGERTIADRKKLATVLTLPQLKGEVNNPHPAAFPVRLPIEYILAMTQEGGGVLDPFMGSGTTILACEQTGRIGFGMDRSPQYCTLAIRRWEAITGHSAHKVDNAP